MSLLFLSIFLPISTFLVCLSLFLSITIIRSLRVFTNSSSVCLSIPTCLSDTAFLQLWPQICGLNTKYFLTEHHWKELLLYWVGAGAKSILFSCLKAYWNEKCSFLFDNDSFHLRCECLVFCTIMKVGVIRNVLTRWGCKLSQNANPWVALGIAISKRIKGYGKFFLGYISKYRIMKKGNIGY